MYLTISKICFCPRLGMFAPEQPWAIRSLWHRKLKRGNRFAKIRRKKEITKKEGKKFGILTGRTLICYDMVSYLVIGQQIMIITTIWLRTPSAAFWLNEHCFKITVNLSLLGWSCQRWRRTPWDIKYHNILSYNTMLLSSISFVHASYRPS